MIRQYRFYLIINGDTHAIDFEHESRNYDPIAVYNNYNQVDKLHVGSQFMVDKINEYFTSNNLPYSAGIIDKYDQYYDIPPDQHGYATTDGTAIAIERAIYAFDVNLDLKLKYQNKVLHLPDVSINELCASVAASKIPSNDQVNVDGVAIYFSVLVHYYSAFGQWLGFRSSDSEIQDVTLPDTAHYAHVSLNINNQIHGYTTQPVFPQGVATPDNVSPISVELTHPDLPNGQFRMDYGMSTLPWVYAVTGDTVTISTSHYYRDEYYPGSGETFSIDSVHLSGSSGEIIIPRTTSSIEYPVGEYQLAHSVTNSPEPVPVLIYNDSLPYSLMLNFNRATSVRSDLTYESL